MLCLDSVSGFGRCFFCASLGGFRFVDSDFKGLSSSLNLMGWGLKLLGFFLWIYLGLLLFFLGFTFCCYFVFFLFSVVSAAHLCSTDSLFYVLWWIFHPFILFFHLKKLKYYSKVQKWVILIYKFESHLIKHFVAYLRI